MPGAAWWNNKGALQVLNGGDGWWRLATSNDGTDSTLSSGSVVRQQRFVRAGGERAA